MKRCQPIVQQLETLWPLCFSVGTHQVRFWRFLCNDLGLAQAPFFPLGLADPVLTVLFEGHIFHSGTCRGPALHEWLQDRPVGSRPGGGIIG